MGSNAGLIGWLLSVDEIEANLKTKRNHYTPLAIAIITGNMAGIQSLIESEKADLDTKDDEWRDSPLILAAERGYVEIVKALIESDRVDINSQNCLKVAALSIAVGKKQVDVVKFLLETGKVNPNEPMAMVQTPLCFSLISSQYEEIALCLLDSGQVDANLCVEELGGFTPLYIALHEFGREHLIIELMLDRMKAIGIDSEATLQATITKLQADMTVGRTGRTDTRAST